MIIICGGTFDPFHDGHLHVVRWLLAHLQPSQLIVLPASKNPLKDGVQGASGEQRLEMARLALETLKDSRVATSDLEIKRTGPSYTIDTLRALSAQFQEGLTLCIGSDSALSFPQWREPHAILKIAKLLIVRREPVFSLKALSAALSLRCAIDNEEELTNGVSVQLVEIGALPISATRLRGEIAEYWASSSGKNEPQGIQRSVWLYIKDNQLYTRSSFR
ncbi:MAG: nicotinate (nicotinamide) nucleotide adenylyltransferase [Deltaproteobacteria bacterium]|nr:nicotinate (nicotinamide) nucleotide adenylyltransferase [Deltaproteobacteria bacterium]MBI3294362.1 nicotinate (nicotinamide) nucleotide adenylyltransferase [Deltaproteobacteria bacterium]